MRDIQNNIKKFPTIFQVGTSDLEFFFSWRSQEEKEVLVVIYIV